MSSAPLVSSATKLVPSRLRAHSNFTFQELLGPAGFFAFTSLFLLSCFCFYVGHYFEVESSTNDDSEVPLEMVAAFYLIGLLAIFYFVDSVVFWRGMALTLEVEVRERGGSGGVVGGLVHI